jgi:hypothetical protein
MIYYVLLPVLEWKRKGSGMVLERKKNARFN